MLQNFCLAGEMRHVRMQLGITCKQGSEDARLWIPDQILGAYGDRLASAGCPTDFSVNFDTLWLDE
jgi:hypothetical protein